MYTSPPRVFLSPSRTNTLQRTLTVALNRIGRVYTWGGGEQVVCVWWERQREREIERERRVCERERVCVCERDVDREKERERERERETHTHILNRQLATKLITRKLSVWERECVWDTKRERDKQKHTRILNSHPATGLTMYIYNFYQAHVRKYQAGPLETGDRASLCIMYVCIYICTWYIHICIYIHMYTRANWGMAIECYCVHVCMYVYIYMIYIHVCIYTCILGPIGAWRSSVTVYVCVCRYTCMIYIYMCIYTYVYQGQLEHGDRVALCTHMCIHT